MSDRNIRISGRCSGCPWSESNGIAIGSTWEGIAISGARGQSYTGHRVVSRSGRDAVAVAGVEGRATATHVAVAQDAVAEVLEGIAPMFAAGEGSHVHPHGVNFRAGVDFEPRVEYRVHFALGEPLTLERYPELDAFAEHAALNSQCSLTSDALARYFLDERPLCTAAARKHGASWTSILRSEHGPARAARRHAARGRTSRSLRHPYRLRPL